MQRQVHRSVLRARHSRRPQAAPLLRHVGAVTPSNSLRTLARAVFDTAHVLRGRHRSARKTQILLTYWRLTLKLIFVAPILRLKRERVLGFRVETFDYETLHFLFREIFVRGEYWFEGEGDQPLIFDCGANIGVATLFFKWMYPRSEIHAFEPDAATFGLLRRNVQANRLDGVHLHNVALASRAGAIEFFVSASRDGSLLMSLDPQRAGVDDRKRTVVAGAPLSGFINGKPVDLLKLDVEGAEGLVMEDLVESGAIGRVRQLVIEYHHHVDRRKARLGNFLSLLKEAGFEYQIGAVWASPQGREEFQDIMVHAFRSEEAY